MFFSLVGSTRVYFLGCFHIPSYFMIWAKNFWGYKRIHYFQLKTQQLCKSQLCIQKEKNFKYTYIYIIHYIIYIYIYIYIIYITSIKHIWIFTPPAPLWFGIKTPDITNLFMTFNYFWSKSSLFCLSLKTWLHVKKSASHSKREK